MDWQAIAAGLGAVLTGAGGCTIVIREFRRRDRTALKTEIDELATDVRVLRADLVACRRYAFTLADQLSSRGVQPPDPPPLQSGT